MSSTREMYDSLTNYCKSVHSIKENEVHEKSSLFNFTSLNIDNMPPVNYREKSEYKNSDVLLTRTRRGSADMSCKKSLIGTNSFPIQELDA